MSDDPVLRVGSTDLSLAARLRALAADDPTVTVETLTGASDLARLHLVLGTPGRNRVPAAAVDATLDGAADTDRLWRERLRPWADNLRAGRRAPRARQAVLVPHHPGWTAAAARLLARLVHTAPPGLRRADHIGSTAVPGLDAKPLLDLQLVLDRLPDQPIASRWALAAGMVLVTGDFYAIDRHDARHAETIFVNADPAQPVNVHLQPALSPVWREVLTFRDWLRADPEARARYQAVKHTLARPTPHGPPVHVDDYSKAKRAWINDAVARAEQGSA
jgi:dephospho-CoA kinase